MGNHPEGSVGWGDLTREATSKLGEALGGNRVQEARWIVERASGYDAGELIVNRDERVGVRGVAFFDQMLARRCAGEPLQYVLGRWAFRTLELYVDGNVLIPRPETELVAGLAIHIALSMTDPVVVDLGTGSGAIALSVAVEVPTATVWATDVSDDALRIASANLAGLGRAGQRVTMTSGSWFDALPDSLRGTVSVVVSNPPYVAESEELPADVYNWEPHLALFGPADDGGEYVRHLIEHAAEWLAPGGALVIEMAPTQTEMAANLAEACGFVGVRIVNDLADKPRALVANSMRSVSQSDT
jgi:release factor glutamine methyltransferase